MRRPFRRMPGCFHYSQTQRLPRRLAHWTTIDRKCMPFPAAILINSFRALQKLNKKYRVKQRVFRGWFEQDGGRFHRSHQLLWDVWGECGRGFVVRYRDCFWQAELLDRTSVGQDRQRHCGDGPGNFLHFFEYNNWFGIKHLFQLLCWSGRHSYPHNETVCCM